jgi:hypothetical protein
MSNDFKSKQYPMIYPSDKGVALWHFLNKKEMIIRMQAVSDLGKSALLAVEKYLIRDFGFIDKETQKEIPYEDKLTNDNFKRMVGAMIRQILEENGYKLVKTTKISGSKLFSSGAYFDEYE